MLRSNRKSTRTVTSNDSGTGGSTPLPVFHNNKNDNKTVMHVKNGGAPRRARAQRKGGFQSKTPWILLLLAFAFGAILFVFRNQRLQISAPISKKHQQHASMKITSRDVSSTTGVVYDVVVAGAGPAGLTAALFAARAGLTVLVLGSSTGQLSEATALDNFPSFTGGQTKGEDWLVATKQQAASVPGVHFGQGGLLVSRIEQLTSDSLFVLPLNQDKYTVTTRSVIVATGATGRRLGLPYEDILWGKTVHSCAICDGSSYTQKRVVVVGGGDAALDAAILLSRHAESVILIHRRTAFRASNQHNLQLANTLPNVQLRTPYIVTQYETSLSENKEQEVTSVAVEHVTTGKTERISCDGVFVMIGATANTEFVKGSLKLDEEGLILLSKTDSAMTSTSVQGIFAAGEVTDSTYKQAITAAAAGAQAAIDAERWLRQQPAIAIQSNGGLETTDTIPLENTEILNNRTVQLPAKGSPPERREAKTESPDCDLAREDCITSLVNMYPVVVFSKPYCPYCKRALEALQKEGVKDTPFLHVVDLTATENIRAVQETLKKMTGRRTVPNVFLGGKSIGGGDETNALHQSGKLRLLLKAAKAFALDDVSDECDLTEEVCITSVVNKYPVVLFSKPYCPYCKRALEALHQEGVKDEKLLKIIDLTQVWNMGAVQDTLKKMTGRRMVPNVFVGGKSIGGGDETTGLHRDGKLSPLLEQAKALG